ncbi:MAG TPA: hypothetical protein VK465_06290 [Fibrobacteria bacterium]|nr:hypothetical protein [Fibrobacteria bacterium]
MPSALAAWVVSPTRFEIHNEYEMSAEHILGRDASNAPCYNAFRHVVTQLRSDDDEAFYEAPAHAETLVAWRLVDTRWLICRLSLGEFDCGKVRATYSLSDVMPK